MSWINSSTMFSAVSFSHWGSPLSWLSQTVDECSGLFLLYVSGGVLVLGLKLESDIVGILGFLAWSSDPFVLLLQGSYRSSSDNVIEWSPHNDKNKQ